MNSQELKEKTKELREVYEKQIAKMSSEELKKYLTKLYTEKLNLLFVKTIELSK